MSFYTEVIKKSKSFTSNAVINDKAFLFEPFQYVVEKMEADIAKEKLPFACFETYRSKERQLYVYKQGYSKISLPGPHHYGLAVDFVGKVNGKWTWDGALPWKKLGEIGKKYGVVWGGDWKSFPDLAHFQCVPASHSVYEKLRDGSWYPSESELTIIKNTKESEKLVLYRSLYDYANYIAEPDKKQKFLEILNTLRKQISL